jgi:aldose sugar dehydrogenase
MPAMYVVASTGRLISRVASVAVFLVLAGCTGSAEPEPTAAPQPDTTGATALPGTATPTEAPAAAPPPSPAGPAPGTVRPGRVADAVTGLDAPWGVAFLPDGAALVSERDTAQIKRVGTDGSVTPVGTVPGVVPRGEGGLLGIAVASDFAQAPYVYAYYTAADDNRITRLRLDGAALSAPEVVFDGIAKAGNHNGGRIVFGPDGKLYAGTGDASNRPISQDPNSPNGKILRLNPDGSVPGDNPFSGSPAWSIGHRNVQGLAFDEAGRLWASEFGQNTWDELNLIQRGANYGWPEVEGRGGGGEFVDPVAQWSTEEASPSGIAYVNGVIFMAGLRGERLWAIPVPNGQVGTPEPFYVEQYGRLRTVERAPDGSLWLTTSNTDGRGDPRDGDDRILRVSLG